MREQIIDVINATIDDKGITLTALARKTDMTIDALSRACLKKRKLSADEFLALCEVLDIDINQFRACKNQ